MKTVILRNRVIIGGTVYMSGVEVSISDDLYSKFSGEGYVDRLISETAQVEEEEQEEVETLISETAQVEEEKEEKEEVSLDNKQMPKGKTK